MKILYITTIGDTLNFFSDFIQQLISHGHEIYLAANENSGETPIPEYYKKWGCRVYNLSCSRNLFKYGNIKAVKEIKKIVSENKFDIVHCHTPIASVCTRIACRKIRKNGTKLIYTAHGFHFYKGSDIKNWFTFLPVEWLCSFMTDILITINTEDYNFAKKHFHSKQIAYVPGVGIDLKKFSVSVSDSTESQKSKIRNEFDIPDDAFLLLSVGELNENKNHSRVIQAIKDLKIYYIIAGKGEKEFELKNLIRNLNAENRVKLAGFRTDITDFYSAADALILPSIREGLNVSLMEAMACGLPCLAGKIRGNTDLIDDNYGGYLFNPKSIEEIKSSIENLIEKFQHNHDSIKKFGQHNSEKIRLFSTEIVNETVENLYLD